MTPQAFEIGQTVKVPGQPRQHGRIVGLEFVQRAQTSARNADWIYLLEANRERVLATQRDLLRSNQ